jgi:hypothetical protein
MDYVVGIIAIIIIVIIYYLYTHLGKRSPCLNGVWLGDPDFCDESGIDLMTISITDQIAWIVFIVDEETISFTTKFKISGDSITFDDSIDQFPIKQLWKIKDDTLIFYDKDTIYFCGTKNEKLSKTIEIK